MDDPKPQSTEPAPEPQNTNQPYVNEPETYVTPTGEPATIVQSHDPQFAVKRKSGAKKWLVTGLVVLLLAAVGALAYWQWAEAQNAKRELEVAKAQVTAAQEATKQQNDESDSKETKETPAVLSDESIVSNELKLHSTLAGAGFGDATDVVYRHNIQGNFAYGSVSAKSEAGGYNVVLKKDSGMNWRVVWSQLNDSTPRTEPSSDQKSMLGIPSSFKYTVE